MLPGMGNPRGMEIIPITDFRKQRFMDWLCTPAAEREPRLMEELAEELSLTRRTLSNWKKDDEFLEHWEKRHRATIGNPDKINEVLHTLYKTATDPDDPKHVSAAKEFLAHVEGTRPQRVDVTVTRADVSTLSTEQLIELAAMRARDALDRRQEPMDWDTIPDHG